MIKLNHSALVPGCILPPQVTGAGEGGRKGTPTERNQEAEGSRNPSPDVASENSLSLNCTCVLFLGLFLQMLAC